MTRLGQCIDGRRHAVVSCAVGGRPAGCRRDAISVCACECMVAAPVVRRSMRSGSKAKKTSADRREVCRRRDQRETVSTPRSPPSSPRLRLPLLVCLSCASLADRSVVCAWVVLLGFVRGEVDLGATRILSADHSNRRQQPRAQRQKDGRTLQPKTSTETEGRGSSDRAQASHTAHCRRQRARDFEDLSWLASGHCLSDKELECMPSGE